MKLISKLKKVDRIYIPLKYFIDINFEETINILSSKSNLYIYMPDIVKDRFVNSTINALNTTFSKFNIYGIVVSNIAELSMIKKANTN